MISTGPISSETTVHLLNLKVMNFFDILLGWVLLFGILWGTLPEFATLVFALWPCKDCKYMQVMLH